MSGYAFAPDEALDRAFCRAMRRQLRAAGRALAAEKAQAEAVHRARRCLKRGRALLALLEPAFRKDRWSKEAKELKRAGQRLSGARDEQAKLDALETLSVRHPRAVSASTARVLRTVIEARRRKLERAAAGELHESLADDLERLGKRFRRKALKRFDEDAVLDGIAQTYRRGRQAMRAAYESGCDEDFHAWRREVQTHWRHMQLIEACAPKEVRARARAAKALSGLLGKDHDLWLLFNDFDDRSLPLGATARERLKGAIIKMQAALREEAETVGRQLYGEKPKALGKRLRQAWGEEPKANRVPKLAIEVSPPGDVETKRALLAA